MNDEEGSTLLAMAGLLAILIITVFLGYSTMESCQEVEIIEFVLC